ncbi:telomere binding protein [Tieghemiomyces parasiticus]|uniref:Telomere binding protein n=1 Tax=Tieghemiomyces parasiticus TaxID=78921 RepID=A0A9W8E0B2_9FUNG|nr:telomere binding protein [Tieghemiomyces parasiticus]
MDLSHDSAGICREKIQQFYRILQRDTLTKHELLRALREPLVFLGLSPTGPTSTDEAEFTLADLPVKSRALFLTTYYPSFVRYCLTYIPPRWLDQFSKDEREEVWNRLFGLSIVTDTEPLPNPHAAQFDGISESVTVQAFQMVIRLLSNEPSSGETQCTLEATGPTSNLIHSTTLAAVHALLVRYVQSPHLLVALYRGTVALSKLTAAPGGRNRRLGRLISHPSTGHNAASGLDDWQPVLASLVSLPDRVANHLARGAVNPSLMPAPFAAELTNQFYRWVTGQPGEEVFAEASPVDGETKPISFQVAVLAKLGNVNQFDRLAELMWEGLDETVESGQRGVLESWVPLFQLCDDAVCVRFFRAVLSHLHQKYLRWDPGNYRRAVYLLVPLVQAWTTPELPSLATATATLSETGQVARTLRDMERILLTHFILGGAVRTETLQTLILTVYHMYTAPDARHAAFARMLDAISQVWTSPTFLSATPTGTIESVMESLILTVALSPAAVLQPFTLRPATMHGVQHFLECPVPETRYLGLVAAECISQRIDPSTQMLDFGLPKDDSSVNRLRELGRMDGEFGNLASAPFRVPDEARLADRSRLRQTEKPTADVVKATDEPARPLIQEYRKIPHATEVNPVTKNEKYIPRPRFLREMMAYLAAHDDPDRFELGLETAADCIQAADSGDLEYNAATLTTRLLRMSDTFDTPTFAERREAALVALLVRLPRQASPLIASEVFEREYTLGQRIAMLVSLAHASGRLAHADYDQDCVARRTAVRHVEQAQRQFERLQVRNPDPLHIVSPSPASALGTGRVTRYSRKLEIQKEQRAEPAKKNGFLALAGPVFFFPLLGGIYSRDSYFDVTKEPLVFECYLRTLNAFLYHGASSPYTPKMAGEYWQLIQPMLSRSQTYQANLAQTQRGGPGLIKTEDTRDNTLAYNVLESALIGAGVMLKALTARQVVPALGRGSLQFLDVIATVFMQNHPSSKVQSAAASVLLTVQDTLQELRTATP